MTDDGPIATPRALALALALLLLIPTWVAAKNGLSGLHARPAIDYLQAKRVDDYAVTMDEWDAVRDSLVRAERLMPGNPQYLSALGWLEQLRLVLDADEAGSEQTTIRSHAAIAYFERAIEHRPTSSSYWGNLALEYFRAGRIDSPSFSAALTNTARFGPWKNDAQRLVADLGADNLDALTPRARQAAVLNVERGLHRQPQIVLELIEALGRWPEVCSAHQAAGTQARPHLEVLCAQLRQRGPD